VAIFRLDTIYQRSYIDMIQHRTIISINVGEGERDLVYTDSVGVCAGGKEPYIQHVLSCLSMTMYCTCRVGSCPVGCGRSGPVFDLAVQYFLEYGGGRVSHRSATVVV